MAVMVNDLVGALEAEGEAIAAAASRMSLDTRVPTCPDWTVADLLAHVGLFTAQVTGKPWAGNDPYAFTLAEVPDPAKRVEWYRALVRDCADALRRSLSGDHHGLPKHLIDKPMPFAGMLAREIPVHRWDVENAAGDALPLPQLVAAAGLEAMLGNFLPTMWRGVPASGKCVSLVANDIDDEWTVAFVDGGPVFDHGPSTRDSRVTVTGTASDLMLMMFRRPGGATQFVGDISSLPRPWHPDPAGGLQPAT